MKKNKKILRKLSISMLALVILLVGAILFFNSYSSDQSKKDTAQYARVSKDDEYYKKILTKEQYYVLRQGGTDQPYSHREMLTNKRKGTYVTADCNEPVFRSEQKYESGTGWPSFTAPINNDAVILKEDSTFGMKRVEVLGKKCGGHLGHVFDDGPAPLGKRYCINASALKFIPDKEEDIKLN